MMQRSFGPASWREGTGELKVACVTRQTYCFLGVGGECTADRDNARTIPDRGNTPDWCPYRAQAVQDCLDMEDAERLGLRGQTRDTLRERLKALPMEARGVDGDGRPRRLNAMTADQMAHAILDYTRVQEATP